MVDEGAELKHGVTCLRSRPIENSLFKDRWARNSSGVSDIAQKSECICAQFPFFVCQICSLNKNHPPALHFECRRHFEAIFREFIENGRNKTRVGGGWASFSRPASVVPAKINSWVGLFSILPWAARAPGIGSHPVNVAGMVKKASLAVSCDEILLSNFVNFYKRSMNSIFPLLCSVVLVD